MPTCRVGSSGPFDSRALELPAPYDPGVAPLVLTLAGVLALATAALIQRGFGSRARVGRLLAVAPKVSVAEAVRLAESGEARYVRVDGRLDSDEEFEDDAHRPLVVRRTTLEWRPVGTERSWTKLESNLETVPFTVNEGLDEIRVDSSALAEGLVVVPREHHGVARDLDDRAPPGVPSDAPIRMTVELASTVEHGIVAGVPRKDGAGRVVIGPGLGRPLVLTTLETDEAMRVLTGGAIGRARIAVACLAAGGALLVIGLLWFLGEAVLGSVATALAASPDPTLRPGTDTRTTGGGPGLVGAPLLAIIGVLVVALASVAATLAYVRLTGGRKRDEQERRPRPW